MSMCPYSDWNRWLIWQMFCSLLLYPWKEFKTFKLCWVSTFTVSCIIRLKVELETQGTVHVWTLCKSPFIFFTWYPANSDMETSNETILCCVEFFSKCENVHAEFWPFPCFPGQLCQDVLFKQERQIPKSFDCKHILPIPFILSLFAELAIDINMWLSCNYKSVLSTTCLAYSHWMSQERSVWKLILTQDVPLAGDKFDSVQVQIGTRKGINTKGELNFSNQMINCV